MPRHINGSHPSIVQNSTVSHDRISEGLLDVTSPSPVSSPLSALSFPPTSYGFQTTLRRSAKFEGIGLHSGKKVSCIVNPAPAGSGIVFVRVDQKAGLNDDVSLPGRYDGRGQARHIIKADITRVKSTTLCTSLSSSDGSNVVHTVEHLMAALAGLGIDNARIEIDAPEVPILDGSSREFFEGLRDAGVKSTSLARKVLRLKKSVSVRDGDRFIEAKPAESFSISASIDFSHPSIGAQKFKFDSAKTSFAELFAKEIAGARTFGFLRDVEMMRRKGLALGGSLDNAIVLDETSVLNPEGLRFHDEFVRHKILDAIGDFALLGMPLLASVEIHRSGHDLHAQFLRRIIEDAQAYDIIEVPVQFRIAV